MSQSNRPLTDHERRLSEWLLEHGSPEAKSFLDQLELAQATSWRCPCGCASFNFKIEGRPEAPPGVHTLSDFMFGNGDETCGVFIYSSKGILSGVEVVGYGCDAPKTLPEPSELRPMEGGSEA